jgi:choice-of-anchor A domain-containing protein
MSKCVRYLLILLSLIASGGPLAMKAVANEVQSAQATIDCTGYKISLTAIHLTRGTNYSLAYSMNLTPKSGSSQVITGTIPLVGPSNGTYTTTVTGAVGLLYGDYTFSGDARLVRGTVTENTISITFSPASLSCPLCVKCASVTAGDVGATFNSGPIHVSGGKTPYTYAIVGTLPSGLTLNSSTGVVSGKPTAAGTFTVKVTDAEGNSSAGCKITIDGRLSVTCAAVRTGDVGAKFNSGPMTVTGGVAPYSYSIAGKLPAGLTLNTSTGAVSGIPTGAGIFTVKVTDATGNSSTACALTINGPLSVSCAAKNIGEVGVPFESGAMSISGGTAPFTYSIVGTLPAGLTLNTTTGEVSGTPTAAGTFQIEVKDAAGNSSTSCSITIHGPLVVTCSALNTGSVGAAFASGAMRVTGGTAPYLYSIEGKPPAGLTLNSSTGDVTGTPTATGTFTVKVTDADGAGSTSCSIVIAPSTSGSCTMGLANAYNLVSLKGDLNDSADISGRIAAAGAVNLVTTIGSALRNGDPLISLATVKGIPYAIVADGGIPNANSINLNGGGSVFSSTVTSANLNFANESGGLYAGSKLIVGGPSPVDFPALDTLISNLSSLLSGEKANGAICQVDNSGSIVPGGGCPSNPTYFNPGSQHYNPSWLVLYGASTTTNVFNLTQDEFQNANKNLDIEVPTGSTTIVNVAGSSDTLQAGIYFEGRQAGDADAGDIVFNFPDATAVTINGQMDATLLAPNAFLSGSSQMGGVYISASIGSTGEVHYVPFSGSLPCTAK